MNERILELVKQAGIHFHKGGTLDAGPNGIAKFVLYSDMEKFAELIVKECIEVFSKDMPDPMSPDYQLGTLNEVVNRVCNVAEHFGVEE